MPLVNSIQAAKMLGISSPRVRQLAIDGRIKGEKFGRDWMFRSQDVKFTRLKRGPKIRK